MDKATFYDKISILRSLSYDEVLAQLAEESSELCQAALKYRRAIDQSNPTPFSEMEAFKNLMEEVRDVFNLLFVTNLIMPDEPVENYIDCSKIARWRNRLEGLEKVGGV